MKKFLSCVALCAALLSLAAAAWADPALETYHFSDAKISEKGTADYSNAKFNHIELYVSSGDTEATAAHMSAIGELTIAGGEYTYEVEGQEIEVSGAEQKFQLRAEMEDGDDELNYSVAEKETGEEVWFTGASETGLKGQTVAWTFPEFPAMDGKGTIDCLSTAEQLTTAVPYFELEYDEAGENITAIIWRVVDPDASDPTRQISVEYPSRIKVRAHVEGSGDQTWLKEDKNPRNTLSNRQVLEAPVAVDDLEHIEMIFTNREIGVQYHWHFDKDGGGSGGGSGTTTTPTATPTPDHSGSSGCNAGDLGVLGVMALAGLFLRRRSR